MTGMAASMPILTKIVDVRQVLVMVLNHVLIGKRIYIPLITRNVARLGKPPPLYQVGCDFVLHQSSLRIFRPLFILTDLDVHILMVPKNNFTIRHITKLCLAQTIRQNVCVLAAICVHFSTISQKND